MKIIHIVIFTVVTLALLFWLLNFTKFNNDTSGYILNAAFKDTGGIKKGAPVMLAGVEVGLVDDIVLDIKGKGVVMKLRLRAPIPNNSKLKITEKGMLGEMFLLFNFGSSKENYKENSTIKGLRPVSLPEVVGSTSDTVKSVGKDATIFIQSITKLISDKSFRANLYKLFDELPKTISSIDTMIKSNQESMKDGLAGLSNSATEIETVLKKVNDLLDDIDKEKIVNNFGKTVKNLGDMSESLSKEKVGNIVLNSEMAMKKLNENLVSFESLMNGLQTTLKAVNSGKGSVGKLIHEPSLHKNLNKLIKSGTSLVTMLDENPSSIIFGRKKSKTKESSSRSRRSVKNIESEKVQSINVQNILIPLILKE
jgi:phospholipid/cholesterol/gamma-HCH transport system substrate-binding protein